MPATSFELVARRAKARYVTGLSASVTRKDGHQPIIFMQCGPVRYRVTAQQQAKLRPFSHTVLVRPTGFLPPDTAALDSRAEFQRLYEVLAESPSRNEMICADVVAAVAMGRFPLVLTERTEHLSRLADQLKRKIPHLVTLQGGMTKNQIQGAMRRLMLSHRGQPLARIEPLERSASDTATDPFLTIRDRARPSPKGKTSHRSRDLWRLPITIFASPDLIPC